MPRILVVPGALLPAPIATDVLRAADAPTLAGLLARSAPGPLTPAAPALAGAAHLDWLAAAFGVDGRPPATAPYAWPVADPAATAATDAAEPPPPAGTLWFADPVHLAFARDHLLVTPVDEAALRDPADPLAAALLASANDAGAAFGARFVIRGGRWFVRFDTAWTITVAPLEAALHLPVQEVWPDGPAAATWRRLANEVQMAWHALPLNETRAAAGLPVVNGVWLHGGGARQPLQPAMPLHYVGRDAVLRGWQAAGAGSQGAAARPDTLTVWPSLFEAARREDWSAWIEAWRVLSGEVVLLRRATLARRAGALRLVFGGLRMWRTFDLRTLDTVKRWLPADPAAVGALLGEPPPALSEDHPIAVATAARGAAAR